jgi:hypothetical protein
MTSLRLIDIRLYAAGMHYRPRLEAVTQRPRRLRSATAAAAVIVLALTGAAFAWPKVQDFMNGPDASALSCSWPADIQRANPAQTGLIRCYLRAIAHRSTAELRSVVRARNDNGPIGFSSADFAHTADARSGTASATVTGNPNDDADADVAIHYTDGVSDNLEIHTANPTSAQSWRFSNIGIYAPSPDAPSPASP